jgi:hypothetical protein
MALDETGVHSIDAEHDQVRRMCPTPNATGGEACHGEEDKCKSNWP